jgi:hypothetical protein
VTSHPGRVRALLTSAVILGLTTALLATAAGPAEATPPRGASVSDSAHRGLYGRQDPTYDGVYRQGLSILALHASGAPVDRSAVQWLLRQQCPNGRWTSFRADLTTACGAADSNATAMAVMALHAIGRLGPARKGLRWLQGHQLAGGGWEYSAGWGADSNSTGLVLQAFLALHRRPLFVRAGGVSGFGFLRSLQLGCTAVAAQRGALDYNVEVPLAPNDFATAQAAQALARTSLPVKPARSWTPPTAPDCSGGTLGESASAAVTSYLAGVLRTNAGAIPSSLGAGDDLGSTANAVLSLVAAGTARRQVRAAMVVLQTQARSFVLNKRQIVPGAAALIVLAEHATGGNPHHVAGLDLVHRIGHSITP